MNDTEVIYEAIDAGCCVAHGANTQNILLSLSAPFGLSVSFWKI